MAGAAGAATSLPLPAYVLEDVAQPQFGTVAHNASDGSGTTFERYFSSKGVAVDNEAGAAPVSRGATCTTDVDGVPAAAACPLTDGRFTVTAPGSQAQPQQFPTHVDLDLGAAKAFRHLVVRQPAANIELQAGNTGAPAEPQLEVLVSADGSAFTHVAGPVALESKTSPGFLDFDLGAPQTSRFVREQMVQSEQAHVTLRSLAEVSLLP